MQVRIANIRSTVLCEAEYIEVENRIKKKKIEAYRSTALL